MLWTTIKLGFEMKKKNWICLVFIMCIFVVYPTWLMAQNENQSMVDGEIEVVDTNEANELMTLKWYEKLSSDEKNKVDQKIETGLKKLIELHEITRDFDASMHMKLRSAEDILRSGVESSADSTTDPRLNKALDALMEVRRSRSALSPLENGYLQLKFVFELAK